MPCICFQPPILLCSSLPIPLFSFSQSHTLLSSTLQIHLLFLSPSITNLLLLLLLQCPSLPHTSPMLLPPLTLILAFLSVPTGLRSCIVALRNTTMTVVVVAVHKQSRV